jgi:hypothetical protein
MSAVSVTPTDTDFWQHLQSQIDTLERNCIAEFRSLAEFQQHRSLAPLINRLEALEAKVALLTHTQSKGD